MKFHTFRCRDSYKGYITLVVVIGKVLTNIVDFVFGVLEIR